ncbi:MAG: RNase adapter RapZ [Burkholderiaceae bacterium]
MSTAAHCKLVLVTGLSGSGKSVVLNLLEDSGFSIVDNLPVDLLVMLVRLLQSQGNHKIAVATDARTPHQVERLEPALQTLKDEGFQPCVLFLTANTEALVQRYSETRRRHPFSLRVQSHDQVAQDRPLHESIEEERELLSNIAHLGIPLDTSQLKASALRTWVREIIALGTGTLTLLLQSFAFKDGVPLDADLVFDVRCLPNPHYNPLLRNLTGKDPEVQAFLAQEPSVEAMISDIHGFIEKWMPAYTQEQRSYLTVAIGCTGGQHRSVYCVESLAQRLLPQRTIRVRHRSLLRRGMD